MLAGEPISGGAAFTGEDKFGRVGDVQVLWSMGHGFRDCIVEGDTIMHIIVRRIAVLCAQNSLSNKQKIEHLTSALGEVLKRTGATLNSLPKNKHGDYPQTVNICAHDPRRWNERNPDWSTADYWKASETPGCNDHRGELQFKEFGHTTHPEVVSILNAIGRLIDC